MSLLFWSIIYFLLLFKLFWINPDANYAVVLKDNFKPLSNPVSDKEMTNPLLLPANQRVVPAGWHGKRPWEIPIGPAIFLGKATIVNETVTVLDLKNVPYIVPYQFVMNHLPGKYLPRSLISNEEAAKTAYIKRVEEKLQTDFRKQPGEATISNIGVFREMAKNIFSGPNVVSDYEKENGYFIRTVEIGAIKPTPEVQTALQAAELNKLRKISIDELAKTSGTKEGRFATKAALAFEGVNVNFVDIEGLEKASGNVHLANIGAISELTEKNQKKGKK